MKRPVLLLVLMAVAASATALSASIKFTSTWKSMDAGTVSFAGKKVAALVISQDDSLRVSGEESLARELSSRGIQGVATYKIAPKEELQRPETAKSWFEKAAIEGVVAVRPVSAGTRESYTSGTWVTSNYSTLWGYYGYGWGAVYDPGVTRTDTVAVVETLIFSVPQNKLLWAGVTESTNPKDAPRIIKDIVTGTVKEMTKQGLIRRK
jgi:hypothetical protein